MRPLAFWTLVAAFIFAAMTVLWGFGEEPTGLVLVLASVMWWGSALALVVFGLVAIWRWRREPAERPPREDRPRRTRTGASKAARRRTPALSRRSSPSSLD